MTGTRLAVVRASQVLAAKGLNEGSAGNVSVRHGSGMLITPSGLPPAELTAQAIVEVTQHGEAIGTFAPSSEWQLHQAIYQARPEVGAVVHTHAPFATALACQRRDIPPFHYMIARFGGSSLRCAPYALFGTRALSDAAVTALEQRSACLLANHGMVAVGRDLTTALANTLELETLCEQYWRTLQLGPPVLLSDAEMAEVLERFNSYGRPQPRPQD